VKRLLLVAALAIALGAAVASAMVIVKPSLDRAEKWISIAGVAASTVLGVAAWRYTRRGTRDDLPASTSGQTVAGSHVGGDIVQVRGVRGSVRIGPGDVRPTATRPKAPPAFTAGHDGQSVSGSSGAGRVRQVDGVDGDVDLG
jgi:hypothetical protein